jgi:hypothetical protein
MPIDKRQQDNTMLYTLIAFVGLFIIATIVAVIFYIQFEKQRTIANDSKRERLEMAADEEWRDRGKIVGEKQSRETYLGTMVGYLDEMVSLIGTDPNGSAQVKVSTADREVKNTLKLLAQEHIDIETIDPNATGLIAVIEKLKTKLDNTTSMAFVTQGQLEELQNRFKDAMAVGFEKEQKLLAEKERYQQQVKEIRQDYNELEALMKKTTDEQVQTLITQRDEARANLDKEHDVLLKTQAELKMTEDRMKRIQEELQAIVPSPDSKVAAYKPDGKIILIDNQAQIVHLNIGSDDRVYPGLTFSVYEKGMPIPKDGKGKAEIEVFDVAKTFSAARIITSNIKRPIIQDDIIANLIWDSEKTNVFVVAGEFDLDSDGVVDYDAVDKIKALIEKWGGRVDDIVSIDTDFLVLGRTPQVLERPTFEQLEVDPMAMEKHEASLQKLDSYKEVRGRAQALSVPVFNYERFLYFTGYKTQTARAGAF